MHDSHVHRGGPSFTKVDLCCRGDDFQSYQCEETLRAAAVLGMGSHVLYYESVYGMCTVVTAVYALLQLAAARRRAECAGGTRSRQSGRSCIGGGLTSGEHLYSEACAVACCGAASSARGGWVGRAARQRRVPLCFRAQPVVSLATVRQRRGNQGGSREAAQGADWGGQRLRAARQAVPG